MELQTLKTSKGNIKIRDAELPDLERLIKLYKAAFPVHTIFEQPDDEVQQYLEKRFERFGYGEGLIVASAPRKAIVGAILLRKEHQDADHTRWKYGHFAVHQGYQRFGIGTALLSVSDDRLRKLIGAGHFDSAKVEVYVAENERGSIPFYVDRGGFTPEGTLDDYYRLGEPVEVLGKTIQ